MMQIGLISLGSGAAAALLFATIASGSVLSIILCSLAPMPIIIAALGWTHWAGLIAAVGAACALGLIFGGDFLLTFLLGIGLPAWWLGYLAMLARPVQSDAAGLVEWYPAGRLVMWAALLSALSVIIAIPNFGLDGDSFRNGLRNLFESAIRARMEIPANAPLTIPGISDAGKFLDVLVALTPGVAAVLGTMTNLINLWLAGRVVKLSGLLRRPWPDLSAMELPKFSGALLLAAFAASFTEGLAGVIGNAASASLLMAFAVLGLAVLHTITRGMDARPFVLVGAYVAVCVFGWPVLALSLLGLAESVFYIRKRLAHRRGPPAPT
ncbi:MAG TPA: DUF2232 domain-containing protein [Pseudolabrys sp.]|nr:DUF2232 domain-containing protein [Pseudolabrys sp.]